MRYVILYLSDGGCLRPDGCEVIEAESPEALRDRMVADHYFAQPTEHGDYYRYDGGRNNDRWTGGAVRETAAVVGAFSDAAEAARAVGAVRSAVAAIKRNRAH